MKIASLSAVMLAASLSSGLTVAREGPQDAASPSVSSRTRAEVLLELGQARASGRLEPIGESYGGFDAAGSPSARTRAEVLAEFVAARRAGALDTRNASASVGSFRLGEIASTRSRGEVLAELTRARNAQGGLSRGERSGS